MINIILEFITKKTRFSGLLKDKYSLMNIILSALLGQFKNNFELFVNK